MVASHATDGINFELGEPALVCRWRLANRRLPLENRHLRALLARIVNGQPVTTELAAWAKQHLEWNLDQGAAEHPDGVLMLVVDTQGRAAMSVGPYAPLEDTSAQGLAQRAALACHEAALTGVAPETLWAACAGALVWDPCGGAPSGAASLVVQLAQTLGIAVSEREGLAQQASVDSAAFDELFVVSDEHGVVPASDAAGPMGARLSEGYRQLLERR